MLSSIFIAQQTLLKCRNPTMSSLVTKHDSTSDPGSKSLSQGSSALAPWPGDAASSVWQPRAPEGTSYAPSGACHHPSGCQRRSFNSSCISVGFCVTHSSLMTPYLICLGKLQAWGCVPAYVTQVVSPVPDGSSPHAYATYAWKTKIILKMRHDFSWKMTVLLPWNLELSLCGKALGFY